MMTSSIASPTVATVPAIQAARRIRRSWPSSHDSVTE